MAYLTGSFRNLEVVLELHSRDPRRLRGDGSSRDRVVLVDWPALGKLVRGSKTIPSFEVPLLSREGLTRRLLPGAAAPWSPTFEQAPENSFGLLLFDEKAAVSAAP